MASVELVKCDSFFCPVQALIKYKQCVAGPLSSNLPVFRLAGVNYTSKILNSDLKNLLQVGCVSFYFSCTNTMVPGSHTQILYQNTYSDYIPSYPLLIGL